MLTEFRFAGCCCHCSGIIFRRNMTGIFKSDEGGTAGVGCRRRVVEDKLIPNERHRIKRLHTKKKGNYEKRMKYGQTFE